MTSHITQLLLLLVTLHCLSMFAMPGLASEVPITFPKDIIQENTKYSQQNQLHNLRNHQEMSTMFEGYYGSERETSPFLPESCGVTFYIDRYLYLGDEAPMAAYPWIALLGYKDVQSDLITFKCAGSLITESYVLTSAKCAHLIKKRLNRRPIVRLGEWNIRTSPDCITTVIGKMCSPGHLDVIAEQVFIHPKYKRNDIALVKLTEPVKSNETFHIHPVCLPSSNFDVYNLLNNRTAVIAGWGTSKPGQQIENNFDTLHQTRVMASPASTKQQDSNNIPKKISVSEVDGVTKSIGDLGSGLVGAGLYGPPFFILGVASGGNIALPSNSTPGIFTSVVYYRTWIKDTIRKSL